MIIIIIVRHMNKIIKFSFNFTVNDNKIQVRKHNI